MAYLRARRFDSAFDSKDVVASMPIFALKHMQMKVKALQKGGSAWWNTKQYRKHLTDNSKFFVTADGFINGYFTIAEIMEVEDGFQIYFFDHQKIKPIEMKGFQGIRYRNFEFEEIEE